MSKTLETLDTLIADLHHALAREDWDELARLNGQVSDTVEPVMAEMETGELAPEPVRERLAELQVFCNQADAVAGKARSEAKAALKAMNQNRSAAKAYQNISSNRPK